MKLYELKAIAKRLNDFTFISRARRVEDNTLELVFDKNDSYFFNMTKGHSFIYKEPAQRTLQGYNEPLDHPASYTYVCKQDHLCGCTKR